MVTKIFLFFLSLFLFGVYFCEAGQTRLIILGFDGVDPALLEKWIAQGKLPHLAALRASGTYLPLGTTLPPQSPVSWAAFATGMNPGKTRIFDFLTRMPGSYYPDFAMVGSGKMLFLPEPHQRIFLALLCGVILFGVSWCLTRHSKKRMILSLIAGILFFGMARLVLQWIPTEIPKPVSRRAGEAFWSKTARKGIPSVVIQVPVTFPAEPLSGGRILSGLGVPDVRKTYGTFSFYTTEKVENGDTEMGGKIIPVSLRNHTLHSFVWGPKNFTKEGEPDILPEIQFRLNPGRKLCTLQFQGQSYTLKEGEWTPWVSFRFDFNPLFHLYGIGRFYLIETSPVFKLYLSPINFNPARVPPNVALSAPRHFSRDLAQDLGLFKTLGWAIDTWALNENRIDEKAFLEDLFFTERKRKEIMFHELAKKDWRLFVGVFEGTDRVQHMFWRTLDPTHPAYSAEEAAQYGGTILKVYQEMDETVGEVMKRFVDSHTILFVLSDHGFHSFRRALNLNTWFVKRGYMTLKGTGEARERNLADLFGQGEFWPNVDWSGTQAYALGLAGVYINRAGREPLGTVSPEEYESLRSRLIQDLLALRDPKTGEAPILRVYRREEVYSGPYVSETPDLILGMNEGYRISWQTALGGIPKDVFEDNLKKWSGDHCSADPSITAGVFLCNRKLSASGVGVIDIAPTVLELFGLPSSPDMDGKSFWKNSDF